MPGPSLPGNPWSRFVNPSGPAINLSTSVPGGRIGPSGMGTLPTGPGPMFGAGQGPVPSTGQLNDNPFQNSFNFQIPSSPAMGAPSDNSSQNAATGSNGGYGQYLPIIVVGVIVAGLGYYLFQRKK